MNLLILVLLEDYHYLKLQTGILSADSGPPQAWQISSFTINEDQLQNVIMKLIIVQIIVTSIMSLIYITMRTHFIKILTTYEYNVRRRRCVYCQRLYTYNKICHRFPCLLRNDQIFFNISYFFSQSGAIFYYVAYMTLAFLGYMNPIFSSILLIDIFRQYPQLRKILQSIWIPSKQIMITMGLFLLITYYFVLFYYFNYYQDVDPLCNSLSGCYTVFFDLVIRPARAFSSCLQQLPSAAAPRTHAPSTDAKFISLRATSLPCHRCCCQ